MQNLKELLTDLFGCEPEPDSTAAGGALVNYGRTRVTRFGDDHLSLTNLDGTVGLVIPMDSSIRDAEDAANFVIFANNLDESIYWIERKILEQIPEAQISHGREDQDAPTDSFITTKHAWIKLSRTDNGYSLTYWGGVLDGTYQAATVDGAARRFIEMDRFAREFEAETAETKFWEAR